jgi:hypothetical protein
MVSIKNVTLTNKNQWQNFEDNYAFQEDASKIEVLPYGGIRLSPQTLDELGWKTKTKITIIEQDNDLHQITLGKELQGEEFVNALNKLRDRF